jgi:chaperonin GroEL (HSP60 family)
MRVINPATAENVDLTDIRIVKKVGGTIDDTELVEGLVLNQSVIKNAGGPTRMEKAKIGLIQFQLSPPKPDVTSISENTNNRWRIRSWSMIIDRWIRFSRKNELIY